ncbi:hypothetical protein [Acetobacter conturbans]|uniref:hypothetical protein n=1 Tax=Acetobacter conturbans TaxID=1737472 RepID=UPI0018E94B6D|nr:hypothetical protein [Acetobacter conturbans]
MSRNGQALHLADTISGEVESHEGDLGKRNRDSEILILGSVLAVYLTLGGLYESVFHLLSISFAGIGAVRALDLSGLPFSDMAVSAMLRLTGSR